MEEGRGYEPLFAPAPIEKEPADEGAPPRRMFKGVPVVRLDEDDDDEPTVFLDLSDSTDEHENSSPDDLT
jgi:hypothetical protein